ncbi:hypothetical protein GYMLUDRAFT_77217 [Collybiopsis luxurians FD-317 M1]|uniref:Uncharacterized protein n=1 Tax=Collybiopsis luxurians FD-317 M1 TaxID=944289 RepID=A0A0D0AUD9_9AGAR|nr:hypothetical protein GYMLUDRAFT_77217 [Collybiopsis luxurians FD-317 M1]
MDSQGPTGNDPIGQLYGEALGPLITALTFQVLFYGIYISLGVTYVNLMARQKNDEKFLHLFYPISTLLLFMLATAGIIISTYDVGNMIRLLLLNMVNLDPTDRESTFVRTRTAIGVIYSLANFLGDIVLIYRCYFVWNGKWLAIVAPAFLSIVNTAVGLASTAEIQLGSKEEFATGGFSSQVAIGDHLLYAFLGVNVFNNILLTGLIAGRLWYINNAAAKLFGTSPSPDKRYNAIVAMFLESGSLYPIALIICLVIQVTGSPASMDLILLQIVGIAPMLILVRTTLGVSIENAPRREDIETELEEANLRPYFPSSYDQKYTPFSSAPTGNSSFPATAEATFSDYNPHHMPHGDSRSVLTDNKTMAWNHSRHPISDGGHSVEGGREPISPSMSYASRKLEPVRSLQD